MARMLEVAVDSLASARAAIAGGADRLELCSALAVGGLTPYAELLQQIRRESTISIRCLMRPRARCTPPASWRRARRRSSPRPISLLLPPPELI